MITEVVLRHVGMVSLRVPENITLVELPHYRPELNPIENLRHSLKSRFWSNKAYDDDELEQAVLDEDIIKSVYAAP